MIHHRLKVLTDNMPDVVGTILLPATPRIGERLAFVNFVCEITQVTHEVGNGRDACFLKEVHLEAKLI